MAEGQYKPNYILVPAEAAMQGLEHLAAWRIAIGSGQPICREGKCWSFGAVTSADRPTIRHDVIAACPVTQVQNIAVPSGRCMVVAVATGDMLLVRAVVSMEHVSYSAGRPDLEIRIHRPDSANSNFAEVVSRALCSPLLNLAAEHATTSDGGISVYGIANYRTSPFLTGWRKIITVHLQGLRGALEQGDANYAVVVTITAYISKQATRRSQDYRLPEESQQALCNAQIGPR
jgi:hypothetical protein